MLVKLIPETEEEIQNYAAKGVAEIEHAGVREFMMFGNKIDSDGDMADFHEWHGSYRYLMGSLNYFYEMINDKRRGGVDPNAQNVPFRVITPDAQSAPNVHGGPMIKRGGIETELEQLDLSKLNIKPTKEAFDDEENEENEEDEAVEVDNQEISVEQLEKQANAVQAKNEKKQKPVGEIKPQGLRIINQD